MGNIFFCTAHVLTGGVIGWLVADEKGIVGSMLALVKVLIRRLVVGMLRILGGAIGWLVGSSGTIM